ncbi:VOC family protein [Celeribacter arenosi]|uniref:VOC family protein n=2 Tax=Celeribacter arenosi TaxID=792649 RepID=A0ABP7K707_9RHOB
MEAYQSILGGKLELMGYDQMPDAPDDLAKSDLVMHAWLNSPLGDFGGSDFPPGEEGDPQKAVTISLTIDDPDTSEKTFGALMEGGALIQAYGPSFFAAGFGMGKDRFGTHWMVMVGASPA